MVGKLDVCRDCGATLGLPASDGSTTETVFDREVPRRLSIHGCDICGEQQKAAVRFETQRVVIALAKTFVDLHAVLRKVERAVSTN